MSIFDVLLLIVLAPIALFAGIILFILLVVVGIVVLALIVKALDI